MAGSDSADYGLFLGGTMVPSAGGERAQVLDPATNRPVASVAVGTAEDARHAMEVAQGAFDSSNWAGDDGSRRSRTLGRVARLLEERLEAFALRETTNMGKTLKEARGDIGFVVRTLEYVAGLADKLEGETIPVPGSRLDYTLREPLGVTVHIAPWNYPLLLAIRSVAPALAAGNAVVLKPASLTPLTALDFARLASEAGVPAGILNVVTGPGGAVGEALVTDSRCRSVTFTGSGPVGQRIAELAARRVVPCTLELGGKSPVLVFPDADLDRAARGVGFGIFGNAGQMCWAGSRLIAVGDAHDALLERVVRTAEAMKVGPGVDPESEMGPLVSRDHLARVVEFVEEARGAGAKVRSGGEPVRSDPLAAGNFLRPTVVTDAAPSSRVAQEEVFGPVLTVFHASNAEEAVGLANDTRYGLFASIWTRDLATAHGVAQRLEAGMVSVNEAPSTFPQSPFAGFKESGVGFEQGRRAVETYTRRKNVVINFSAPKPKK